MIYKKIIQKIKIYGLIKFFHYAFLELVMRPFRAFLFRTYSQKGEDLFIDQYFKYKRNGFYVDIGANDPDRFSNTKRFYQKGWRGINIEPDTDNYRKFLEDRALDINLNIGIAQKPSRMIFYKFETHTLSTFSKIEADKYKEQGYRTLEEVPVSLERLDSVLSKYVPNTHIDFLSVDTEGFDLDVLQSNDWGKFKPTLVCVESVFHEVGGIDNKKKDDCDLFLSKIGYHKIYSNGLNSIFEYHIN